MDEYSVRLEITDFVAGGLNRATQGSSSTEPACL